MQLRSSSWIAAAARRLTASCRCGHNSHRRSEGVISVGVRQLKNSLTRYLRLVDQGQALLVTNRNRVVAVLRKPDRNSAPTLEEKLAVLVAEGKLLPAAEPGPFKPFKPVRVRGRPVSKTIIEDRRRFKRLS